MPIISAVKELDENLIKRCYSILNSILCEYNIPLQYFSLGEYREDYVCLEYFENKWIVYEGTRGYRLHEKSFDSFFDAGCSLYKSVVIGIEKQKEMQEVLRIRLKNMVMRDRIYAPKVISGYQFNMGRKGPVRKKKDEIPVYKIVVPEKEGEKIRVEEETDLSAISIPPFRTGAVIRGGGRVYSINTVIKGAQPDSYTVTLSAKSAEVSIGNNNSNSVASTLSSVLGDMKDVQIVSGHRTPKIKRVRKGFRNNKDD